MWAWVGMLACGRSGPPGSDGDPGAHSGSPTVPTADFCAVGEVFSRACGACHAPDGLEPRLDLVTDPYRAVVGVVGAISGRTLVVPSAPERSFLLAKMEDRQAPGDGTRMPPTGGPPSDAALVRAWIAAGAAEDCAGPAPHTGGDAHPGGWASPGLHGAAAKFRSTPDCRTCHGADLGGGPGGACDACHAPGWRTDCAYCHGRAETGTGAPPEDLDDNPDPATGTFPPHAAHESGRLAAPLGCGSCHPPRAALLEPGHWLDDDTPGEAEVALVGGGSYAGHTCSDVPCHADGRDPTRGDVGALAGPLSCTGCHAGAASSPGALAAMSGGHAAHLSGGAAACGDCHPDAAGDDAIDDPALHVDGAVQVALPPPMTSGATCDGPCHGHVHLSAPW